MKKYIQFSRENFFILPAGKHFSFSHIYGELSNTKGVESIEFRIDGSNTYVIKVFDEKWDHDKCLDYYREMCDRFSEFMCSSEPRFYVPGVKEKIETSIKEA